MAVQSVPGFGLSVKLHRKEMVFYDLFHKQLWFWRSPWPRPWGTRVSVVAQRDGDTASAIEDQGRNGQAVILSLAYIMGILSSLEDRNSFEVITVRFLSACVSMGVYVCSCVHRSEVSFGCLSSGNHRSWFLRTGVSLGPGAHQLIKLGFSTGCWGSNSGISNRDISPARKYLSLKLEVCAG